MFDKDLYGKILITHTILPYVDMMKPKHKRLTMPVFVSENKEIYRQWREWQSKECDKIESQARETGTLDAELSYRLLQRRVRISVDLNDNVIPREESNNPESNVSADMASTKSKGKPKTEPEEGFVWYEDMFDGWIQKPYKGKPKTEPKEKGMV